MKSKENKKMDGSFETKGNRRCDIASFPLVEVVQVSVSFSAYMRRSGSEKSDRSLSFFFVSSRLI